MHSGLLSGLLFVLAAALPNPASAPAPATAPLLSVLAQAETPTAAAVPTDTTPTALATPELTATAEVTATATVTGTPFVPTPIEPTAPQGNLQGNPFDWGFLTSPPTEPKIGPFGWFYIAFMLALTAAGIYFYFVKRPQWKRTNAVWHKAANRFAPPAIWIGLIGLLFALFRVVSLDFFNLRIWFYIMMLAALALFGWFVYWYRTSYPKEMARYQKTLKARQYMPGKARSTPPPPRPATTTPSASASAAAPSGAGAQTSRHAPRNKNRKRR